MKEHLLSTDKIPRPLCGVQHAVPVRLPEVDGEGVCRWPRSAARLPVCGVCNGIRLRGVYDERSRYERAARLGRARMRRYRDRRDRRRSMFDDFVTPEETALTIASNLPALITYDSILDAIVDLAPYTAQGRALDRLAEHWGIVRNDSESDADLRERALHVARHGTPNV